MNIDLSKAFLKKLFKEAKEKKEFLWPDEAFKKLGDFWGKVKELPSSSKESKPPVHRLNPMSEVKRVHKLAVDIFYETYAPQKKGAPAMTEEYAKFIFRLSEQGITHREIAEQASIPIDKPEDAKRVKDVVRKRIDVAKKKLKIKE